MPRRSPGRCSTLWSSPASARAMWGRRALYALLLLCTLMGQLLDVGYLFHFLFFAVLSLPALGLAVSLPAMLGARAELSAPAGRIRRGQAAAWKLRVVSRSRLPLARWAGRLCLTDRTAGRSVRRRLAMSHAIPGAGRGWGVDTEHCSLVECRVERLRVCDCLGLFTLPVKPPEPGELLVQPLPVAPGRLDLPEGTGRPVPAPRGKSASGEDYELRPFREGDSLRTVHWKMSAKRDELVTRELLEDRRPVPVLTFDHFGPRSRMDRTLDRLAGLSAALLERERPHEVRWAHPATGAVRRQTVSCEREWLACLRAILFDPVPDQGRSVLDQPLAVDRDTAIHHIHVTGEEARREP